MPYAIVIKRQARNKLESLPRDERTRVAEKIGLLGQDPDNPELDTKKLMSAALYRLRVGNWRVIYDRQDVLKIIAVERISARGDAYK